MMGRVGILIHPHQQTQGFGVEPVDLAVVGRLRRPCRPVELADLQTWQLSVDSLVNAVNLQSHQQTLILTM